MDDADQASLKSKIMDNIHKYDYLTVFGGYMHEAVELAKDAVSDEIKAEVTLKRGRCAIPNEKVKLIKTFTTFVKGNGSLRALLKLEKAIFRF